MFDFSYFLIQFNFIKFFLSVYKCIFHCIYVLFCLVLYLYEWKKLGQWANNYGHKLADSTTI